MNKKILGYVLVCSVLIASSTGLQVSAASGRMKEHCRVSKSNIKWGYAKVCKYGNEKRWWISLKDGKKDGHHIVLKYKLTTSSKWKTVLSTKGKKDGKAKTVKDLGPVSSFRIYRSDGIYSTLKKQ